MTQIQATDPAPVADAPVTKRVVPGAPPPVEKAASKKKRKAKTKADGEAKEDASNPAPAPSAAEVPASGSAEFSLGEDKKGSMLDMINKRIRNFTKKIQRVKEYQTKSDSSLNEDQKRAVASLPTLEGILHELEDTKKTIEPLEAHLAKEVSLQRLESESAARARAQQAVADAKAEAASKFTAVLELITLDASTLPLESQELNALTSFIAHLTSSDSKATTISNLVNGEGDWEGFSFTQILEFARRIPAETVEVAEPDVPVENHVDDTAPVEEEQTAAAEEPTALAETDADKPTGPAGGFHFMLESELEPQPPVSSEGAGLETPTPVAEASVNGVATSEEPAHVQHGMEDPIAPQTGNLDWAADDGADLPPLNALEAKFGTSGEVTPEVQPEPQLQEQQQQPQQPAQQQQRGPSHQKRQHPQAQAQSQESDGFISIPPRRGGGERGFRGGERGGRGRGGFRGGRGGGGERSGRGRGGFRGGERGRGGAGGSRGGRPAAEPTAA